MFKRRYIGNESGIVLVISLVMLLALTVIGLSALTTTTLDIQISGNERRGAEALNLADAGLERILMDALYDYKYDPLGWSNDGFRRISTGTAIQNTLAATFGEFSTGEPADALWGNPFGAAGVSGSDIGSTVDVYGGPQELPAGSGNFYRVLLMRDSSEPDEVYARSYAELSSGARKIVQLRLNMNKVDPWRNAVFAGRGSATETINGNINVAGSVHVLGTGATNNWTISGAASVMNGYHGLRSTDANNKLIKSRLRTLEVVDTYSGQPVYSLESVFRVKNVQVGIQGSGNIGEQGGQGALPDGIIQDPDTGIYYQSEVDALYANKTITGADGGIFSIKEAVMPDGYDLGDKISMPELNDDYDPNVHKDLLGNSLDPATQCVDPSSCTYKDYVTTMSVEVDGAVKGCSLQPGVTPDFEQGSVSCTDSANPNTCTCNDANGCFKWVNSPGVDATGDPLPNIFIAGRVEYKGCPGGITIGPAGGSAVTYVGKGIFYTAHNVTIDRSFVNYADNTFLDDDLIAVLTENNLSLAESAQASYMGAFYAAGTIGTNKTSDIVGALVSNYFCMGTGLNADGSCQNGGNAADIYYTPFISETLYGMGMLMGKMVYTFDSYEYREKY